MVWLMLRAQTAICRIIKFVAPPAPQASVPTSKGILLWSCGCLNHLLNLVAPLQALALLLPLCARVFWSKTAETPVWIAQAAINL